jgi:ketosteroid isomerase-like protein
MRNMEKSIDIKNLIHKAAEANKKADVEFWKEHISKNKDVIIFGTAPNEGIKGYENIIKALQAELSMLKPTEITIGDMYAFSEGTVGWYFVRSTAKFSNGSELPTRASGVMHMEDGIWKVVMQSTTFDVPDEKMKNILEKWYF